MDESLPELIPVCPHCNYGGPGATFDSVELVLANAEFYPRLEADGSIEMEYTGSCKVLWDTQEPAKNWIPGQPRYLCPKCWRLFDEFKIATKEEFAWIKMMQARS